MNKKNKIISIIVLFSIMIFLSSSLVLANMNWPMYRGDSSHSGYSASSELAGEITQLWSYKTPSYIRSEPVIYGDYVYVVDDIGNLHKFSIADGSLIWVGKTNDGQYTSPLINNGFVYTAGGKLFSRFDIASGTLQQQEVYPLRYSQLVSDGTYLAAGSTEKQSMIFDVNPISLKQSYFETDPIYPSPIIYSGTYIFRDNSGVLHCYDVNGNTKWEYSGLLAEKAFWSPVEEDGVIFISNGLTTFAAIDATSGAQLWKKNFEFSESTITPAVYDGVLYVNSPGKGLVLIDTSTGNMITEEKTYDYMLSPVVTADGVYSYSKEGELVYLSRDSTNTLTVEWSYKTSTEVVGFSVSQGKIFLSLGYDGISVLGLLPSTAKAKSLTIEQTGEGLIYASGDLTTEQDLNAYLLNLKSDSLLDPQVEYTLNFSLYDQDESGLDTSSVKLQYKDLKTGSWYDLSSFSLISGGAESLYSMTVTIPVPMEELRISWYENGKLDSLLFFETIYDASFSIVDTIADSTTGLSGQTISLGNLTIVSTSDENCSIVSANLLVHDGSYLSENDYFANGSLIENPTSISSELITPGNSTFAITSLLASTNVLDDYFNVVIEYNLNDFDGWWSGHQVYGSSTHGFSPLSTKYFSTLVPQYGYFETEIIDVPTLVPLRVGEQFNISFKGKNVLGDSSPQRTIYDANFTYDFFANDLSTHSFTFGLIGSIKNITAAFFEAGDLSDDFFYGPQQTTFEIVDPSLISAGEQTFNVVAYGQNSSGDDIIDLETFQNYFLEPVTVEFVCSSVSDGICVPSCLGQNIDPDCKPSISSAFFYPDSTTDQSSVATYANSSSRVTSYNYLFYKNNNLLHSGTYSVDESALSFGTIATFGQSTCALSEGDLYCWGQIDGAAGLPSKSLDPIPQASALATPTLFDDTRDYVKVDGADGAAGYEMACALTSNGQLVCWSAKSTDVFGSASATSLNTLIEVGQDGVVVEDFALNDFGLGIPACALSTQGEIYCWGTSQGYYGSTFTKLNSSQTFVDVFLGGPYVCGLTDANDVYCSFDPALVEVKNPLPLAESGYNSQPYKLNISEYIGSEEIIDISFSSNPSSSVLDLMILTSENSYQHNWDRDDFGITFQFNNLTELYSLPALGKLEWRTQCYMDAQGHVQNNSAFSGYSGVPSFDTSEEFLDYDCAYESHSCLLDAEGHVFCLGTNEYGQLGIGSFGGKSYDIYLVSVLLDFIKPLVSPFDTTVFDFTLSSYQGANFLQSYPVSSLEPAVYNFSVQASNQGELSDWFSSTMLKMPPGFIIDMEQFSDDEIDPNKTISINITVVDGDQNLNASSVYFLWKNSSAGDDFSDWNLVSLTNSSAVDVYTTFTGTFTLPSYVDNFTATVVARDATHNYSDPLDRSFADEFILNSSYDCSWSLTQDLQTPYLSYSSTDALGEMNLTNTGDENYQGECDLVLYTTHDRSSSSGSLFFDLSRENSRFTSLSPGESESFTVFAEFGEDVFQDQFEILVTEMSGLSTVDNQTISMELITHNAGPYLYTQITDAPVQVYLTNELFELEGFVKNLAGALTIYDINYSNTAYNVTSDWQLPSFVSIQSGYSSMEYGSMSLSTENDRSLYLGFNSLATATPGLQTIYLLASGLNSSQEPILTPLGDSYVQDSVDVFFSCYTISDGVCVDACGTQDPDCSLITSEETGPSGSSGGSGTAGSSSGGFGASAEQLEALFQTNATYVLVRGANASFSLVVENPFNDTLTNVSVSLDGFLSQYLDVQGPGASTILPGRSLSYEIMLNAPGYFQEALYPLTFSIAGLVDQSTYNESYTIYRFTEMLESRAVDLYVVEISLEDAQDYFNESLLMIDDMFGLNYSVDNYQTFLRLNNSYFSNYQYSEFRDFYDVVKTDYDALFATLELYGVLDERLSWADYNGLQVPETRRLLSLSEAALSRGDYVLGFERAKDAQLTFALETVGAFNVVRFVVNNWWQVLLSLGALTLLVYFIVLLVRRAYYSFRIKSAVDEKKVLFGLMKQVQKECFTEGKLSMEEYTQNMIGYEERLNVVVSNLIMFTNKKHNLFRFWISPVKRLHSEKSELLGLIKDSQKQYLRTNTLETRVYHNRMKSYSSRLGEIEEQLAFAEAKKKLHSMRWLTRG